MKVAIDGPAGAGKSTVARHLAEALGILYVDTGAMYRVLAWKGLQLGIDLSEPYEMRKLAVSTDIDWQNDRNGLRVFCDRKDVTNEIRTPEVSRWVSVIAAIEDVRTVMVKKQQAIAEKVDVVMDGRDITHCVLPDAKFKFFLTASLEERTRRRKKELEAKGFVVDTETLMKEIRERDRQDKERKVGALKLTEDAILIDTSNLSSEQVVERVLSIIREG